MKEIPISVEEIKSKIIIENSPVIINFNDIVITIIKFSKIIDDRYWVFPFHFHENYEFHYISEGKGRVEIGKNIFDVIEGDFYCTHPFDEHKQSSSKTVPLHSYAIEFKIEFPEFGKTSIETAEMGFFYKILNKSVTNNCCRIKDLTEIVILLEKEFDRKRTGYITRTNGLFLNLILQSLTTIHNYKDISSNKSITYDQQRVPTILNFIEENYSKQITIDDVCKKLFLSSRQINRILLKECNMTFNKYLTNKRNEAALKLLKTNNYSVKQVTQMAGFSSYLNMFRSIKKCGYKANSDNNKNIYE